MASLINLRQGDRSSKPGDTRPLHHYLGQLIAEPFLFARIGYGDELSLHFGAPKLMRSRAGGGRKGSYILGLRASVWQIKPGFVPVLIKGGGDELPDPVHEAPLTPQQLESGSLIGPNARVTAAEPFVSRVSGGYGVVLTFSDGSALVARPSPPDPSPELPAIADWELFTPHGMYLRVGPGWEWVYESSEQAGSAGAGVASAATNLPQT